MEIMEITNNAFFNTLLAPKWGSWLVKGLGGIASMRFPSGLSPLHFYPTERAAGVPGVDDPSIQALNPDFATWRLPPRQPIEVVVCKDRCGTQATSSRLNHSPPNKGSLSTV